MRRSIRLPVLLLLVGPLLAGCGGGGNTVTVSLLSISALDGFVTNTGFVDTTHAVAVGDTDGSFSNVARGFVHFDLSGLPAGVNIVSAELRLQQSTVFGAPYATLGNVVVDHVNIGIALDASDFGALALLSDVGTLSNNPVLELKTLSVTQRVRADLAAARSTSDFRFRYPTGSDGDGADDYVEFNDGGNSLGNGIRALLIVKYDAP